jgi:GTP-binding protein
MKIKNSYFMTSAVKKNQYPETEGRPEIAFVGRSNVGKSSLINMLLNRKGLAKTSSTPGKTRLINFFSIDDLFNVVDLPGYGYARVSKDSKKEWAKIIETYLKERETLVEVFLLVDMRHKPTAEDIQMYEWIKGAGFNGIVIGTKADKLTKSQFQKAVNTIVDALKLENKDFIIPISSESRFGKYDVWDAILEIFRINGYEINIERQDSKGPKR